MVLGKTVFSIVFSRYLEESLKKVLLIDFDLDNANIDTILDKKKKVTTGHIEKISEKLDFLDISKLYNYEINNLEYLKLKKYIDSIKNEYDVIIIDLSSNIKSKYIKNILEISDIILILIEPNLLEIKKARNILEVYSKDFLLKEEKIKIVFNKINKYKIDKNILKEIFYGYKIIGNIKYDEKYNLCINKRLFTFFDKEEYRKIYEKI